MPGDYRIRFVGDLGNLSQFTTGIVGSASAIKGAFRNAAASPVTSLKMPNIQVGNLTTTVDSANRVLIQSGQVFHRVVSGWTADLAKLDAATAKSAKGGLNYRGASINTPVGPAVYGTSVQGGRAGVYAKDLKPTYEKVFAGEFKQITGDWDKILAANKALAPAMIKIAAIEKNAQLQALKNEAVRKTILEQQTAELIKQNVLRKQITEIYRMGKGIAPVFDKVTGKMVTPGVLKSTGTLAEIERLANTPVYRTIAQNAAVQKTDKAGNVITKTQYNPATGVMEPMPVMLYPTKKDMATLVERDINAAKAGLATTGNLQLALRQARTLDGKTLDVLEADYNTRSALLAGNQKELKKLDGAAKKIASTTAAKVKGVEKAYSPLYDARRMAMETPAIPGQLDALLKKSGSLRKDLIKSLQISAPYGTAQFAKEFSAKVENVSVSKDFVRGVSRVSIDAKDATGAVGSMTTAINNNGQTVERWQGSLRNSSSTLKMIAVDFKKVLEWTVATTLVFGAFGAIFTTFSKLNQVNSDLQRFQIVAKSTGEETQAAFDGIAEVAYRTATPLTELTAVMDDIALATRRVGQTSEEWRKSMNSLAEAVGIYTNIAGVDTMAATDQLSAAFKQLQISPQQLITVLNKVTAVAGGNAKAVEEIVASLGSVAEASKAAGFNIDEMIAAVQVLSQVTNKSAADIATSFKNLFGAINAPASEKFLKGFNINIRDSAGNLRDYLDIMKDIYDAVQSGTIPQGRVQDLLRAIAGGPRRAPDAAAVLGNLPRIFETIDTSLNATNEALIANAKIVETNSAKLQKLRTAFDTALVNQFTDSINKLVEVITNLGTAFNSFLGGTGGTLANSVIQFAVLAGGITLLTKGIMGFRGALIGLNAELKVMNSLSKLASPILGNATQIGKGAGGTPIYRSAINLSKAERPGYNKFTTNTKTGPMYEYWPIAQGAQMPQGLKPVPAPIRPLSNLWSGSRGFRFGAAGLGGAALAAGLGVAGQATGADILPTIGTTIGMMGLLSMNPLGIAAGAATIAVSHLFSVWQEGAEKAREKQDVLTVSVYDQIKTLTDLQRSYSTAKEMQEAASKTIEALQSKTSLTTDETESLTAAQNQYVSSTLEVMQAEEALAISREKLLTQLPQLEKYRNLAKNATSLSLPDLKNLSVAMAKDILAASGTFVAQGVGTYREPFPTTPSYLPPQVPAGTRPLSQSPYFGRTNEAYTSVSTAAVISEIRKGGLDKAISFLRSPQSFTGGAGVAVTSELTSTLMILLDLATEEEQKTAEYKEAVDIFQKAVMTLPGALNPLQIMSQNLANFTSQTQANTAFGLYTSEQSTNAAARQTAGAALLTLAQRRNLPTGDRPWEYAQRGRMTQRELNMQLFGPQGFVSSGGVAKTMKVSADEAKDFFKVMIALNPALENLKESTGEFGELAYEYFKLIGIEVEGLHDPTRQFAEDLSELRGEIDDSTKSAKQGLFNELLNLQAQMQGGEFAEFPSVGEDQEKQILALISAYTKLGETFKTNAAILPLLQEKLAQVKHLQGLMLVDTNELLPALLGAADAMGFTGTQVDLLKDAILRLIVALAAVEAIPTIVKKIEIQVQTAMVSGNARRRGQEGGLLDRTDYTNLVTGNQQQTVEDILAEIQKLFNNAAGTAFGGTNTTTGGGGTADKGSISDLEIPKEWKEAGVDVSDYLKRAVEWAKKYQGQIPGEAKEHAKDQVAIMDENNRILLQKGIGEEYLRKAMEALTEEIKKQNDLLAKADTISRIRIGAGDFAALANVPMNLKSGVSIGSPEGPISVNLNINGQILTPAQFEQLANQIAAALKSKIGT